MLVEKESSEIWEGSAVRSFQMYLEILSPL